MQIVCATQVALAGAVGGPVADAIAAAAVLVLGTHTLAHARCLRNMSS